MKWKVQFDIQKTHSHFVSLVHVEVGMWSLEYKKIDTKLIWKGKLDDCHTSILYISKINSAESFT